MNTAERSLITLILSFPFIAIAGEFLPDSNTVALWHFNEGTGDTAYDVSGNESHATIHNAIWVDGMFGKALDFKPAEMSRVLAPNSSSLQITGPITIEAWVKPRNFGPEALNLIVQKGDGGSGGNTYWFAIKSAGKLQIELQGPGSPPYGVLEGTSQVDTGVFQHVAVTWDGTTDTNSLRFYIDGILDTAGTVGCSSLYITNAPLGIGYTPSLEKFFFDGVIDEVRISNIARNILPNSYPSLDSIGQKSVNEGGTLSFSIYATDSELDSIVLIAENLPNNSSFVDSGNGLGTFNFSPDTTQSGMYVVTFIASDGMSADSQNVEINVYNCDAIPGDANKDATLTLSDIVSVVNLVFNKSGCAPAPMCWVYNLLCRGDWNADEIVTLADAIRGVNFLFDRPGGPWDPIPSDVCCLPVP
ncbi:MAG: hypothetical protein L0Y74_09425 [candidate division Zixibacteria bacterium]|nr:hypothetical protein [candidate division Zixibacteria bacterium]